MTDAATPQSIDAPPNRDSIPRWIIPVVLGALLVAASVAIVIVAGRQGGIDAPPLPAAYEPDSLLGSSYGQFDVRQVDGSATTLSALSAAEEDLFTVQFSETARLELLEHVSVDVIELGQWITVIGIPNEVFNFSIMQITIFPDFQTGSDNLATTAGGFYGHEAGRPLVKGDVLRPLMGGEVVSLTPIEPDEDPLTRDVIMEVTLTGPDGDIVLELFADAPLMMLREATLADLESGDRIAVHASTADDPASAGSILISRPPLDPSLLGSEGLGVGGSSEDTSREN
jgi:hypothetical protein